MRVHARTETETRQALADIARRYGAKARTRNPDFRLGELRKLFRSRRMPNAEAQAAILALGDFHTMSAEALGKAITLTFDEREQLNIRTIRCCDRSIEEVAAYQREKKRARDRKSARTRRSQRRPIVKGPAKAARAAAVRKFLSGRTEASASFISDQMRDHPAFRGLDKTARRRAVHRAIVDAGADWRIGRNESGFPTMFARACTHKSGSVGAAR
jgi:hypothetical protein